MLDRDKSKYSVLLVNCWHDSNKGDAAITVGVLNAVRSSDATAVLRVASYAYYPTSTELEYGFRHVLAAYPDVIVVQTCLPALARSVGKMGALTRVTRGIFKLLFPNLLNDTELDKAVRESSVVASNGGLYFGFVNANWIGTAYHLLAFSYPMLLAQRLGIPYVFYGQSFGPFHSGFSRWCMRKLVNLSDGAWARESASKDLLLRLGANPDKVKVVADAAFGISIRSVAPPLDCRRDRLNPGGYIGISIRTLDASGHSAEIEENYSESFRRLIEAIVQEGTYKVALVSHTTGPIADEDDRVPARKLWSTLSSQAQLSTVLIDEDLSPVELAQLYGAAKLTIATRFHAVVLAICGEGPVIAIPYFGLKTQGAMRDLGLADRIVELDDLSFEVLYSKLHGILNNYAEVKRQAHVISVGQYRRAMESGSLLRKISKHED